MSPQPQSPEQLIYKMLRAMLEVAPDADVQQAARCIANGLGHAIIAHGPVIVKPDGELAWNGEILIGMALTEEQMQKLVRTIANQNKIPGSN